MLALIKRFFGIKTPEPTLEPEPQSQDTYPWYPDEFLFGSEIEKTKGSSGPVLHNVSRDEGERLEACQMRDCVRPSYATVMTTAKLDVDIPNAGRDRMNLADAVLPIYRQYYLCDRHYKTFIKTQPKIAYVISDRPLYDPDKDKETQRKLAKAS